MYTLYDYIQFFNLEEESFSLIYNKNALYAQENWCFPYPRKFINFAGSAMNMFAVYRIWREAQALSTGSRSSAIPKCVMSLDLVFGANPGLA